MVRSHQRRLRHKLVTVFFLRPTLQKCIGKLTQILVLQKIKTIQLPITRLKSRVLIRILLLHHQIQLHRARIRLLHPIRISHQKKHLTPRRSIGQHARIPGILLNDPIVVPFVVERLHHSDQRQCPILNRRVLHQQCLVKQRHSLFGPFQLAQQHRYIDRRFSLQWPIHRRIHQVLEQRQRRFQLIRCQLALRQRHHRRISVGIVRLHLNHPLQRLQLLPRLPHHLITPTHVVGRRQGYLRNLGRPLTKSKVSHRPLKVSHIESNRSQSIRRRRCTFALGMTPHHFLIIPRRLIFLPLLDQTLTYAEQSRPRMSTPRISLHVVRIRLDRQSIFPPLIQQRPIGKQILIRPLRLGRLVHHVRPRHLPVRPHRHRARNRTIGRRLIFHHLRPGHSLAKPHCRTHHQEHRHQCPHAIPRPACNHSHLNFGPRPPPGVGPQRPHSKSQPSGTCPAPG